VAEPVDDRCLAGEPGSRRDVIRVSLPQGVDLGRAPLPGNGSERILYRQLYETLVVADCDGNPLKGLAERWRELEGGRAWEFVLRGNARFSDGSEVSALDVQNAWIAGSRKPDATLDPLWSWVRPESVRVTGKRRLVVSLDRPRAGAPRIFAHPALAVAKPAPGSAAPLGTGPYRLASPAGGDTIRCEANPFHPSPGYCPLRVAIVAGADPRDLIGGGGDAVVVRERAALSYASSVPEMQVIPLSWDRLYLLVSPRFDAEKREWPWNAGLRRLREELASDIAVSEARAASSFAFDPDRAVSCGLGSRPGPATPATGDSSAAANVVYRDGDPDSERLASRLVVLEDAVDSTMAEALRVRTDALPVGVEMAGEPFLASLIAGGQWMYVVGLHRGFPDPCLDLELLIDRVPWMRRRAGGGDGNDATLRTTDLERAAVPLVVTRPNLVCRKSLTGVELGWDGIPLFSGAGWSERRGVP
jgi:hypothetical protein